VTPTVPFLVEEKGSSVTRVGGERGGLGASVAGSHIMKVGSIAKTNIRERKGEKLRTGIR